MYIVVTSELYTLKTCFEQTNYSTEVKFMSGEPVTQNIFVIEIGNSFNLKNIR
jgi:hypothetical protein